MYRANNIATGNCPFICLRKCIDSWTNRLPPPLLSAFSNLQWPCTCLTSFLLQSQGFYTDWNCLLPWHVPSEVSNSEGFCSEFFECVSWPETSTNTSLLYNILTEKSADVAEADEGNEGYQWSTHIHIPQLGTHRALGTWDVRVSVPKTGRLYHRCFCWQSKTQKQWVTQTPEKSRLLRTILSSFWFYVWRKWIDLKV